MTTTAFDFVFALERTWSFWKTRRGLLLTAILQGLIVLGLIALGLYAKGTFQRIIGQILGVSVFAACTVIHKIPRAISGTVAEVVVALQVPLLTIKHSVMLTDVPIELFATQM